MQLQRLKELLAARWRPERFTLFLIFLSLVGAGLALALHGRNGVLLDWDSINYISVADSLLAGDGFRQFNGLRYRDWPPLYPMLLAAPGLAGIDPYLWAGWLNALAFALTIFIAGQWLRRRLTYRWLLLWGCLAAALAYLPAQQAAFARSETIFILFTLLALLAAERFLNTERRSALLWAALFTALACLTRYLGLTLVVAIALLLALQAGATLRQRAQRIALYSLTALAPIGLWILRNFLTLGELTGGRSYDVLTVADTLRQTAGVLSDWTGWSAFTGGIGPLNFLPAALLLLALAAALIYGIRAAGSKSLARPDLRPLYIYSLFALVYLILLNAVAYRTTFVDIGARQLIPVWLPLLLTALFALERLRQYIRERRVDESRRAPALLYRGAVLAVRGALFAALILWLSYQVFLNWQQIVRVWNGQLNSYSVWAEDVTLRYLRESVRPDAREWVLSNLPAAVYIYGGRPQQGELPYDILDLTQWMAGGDLGPAAVYALWLYGSPNERRYRYDDQDLRNLPTAETVAELGSGVLLRIRRAAEPGPAYQVQLRRNRLLYRKSPCFPGDTEPLFFLHIHPVDGGQHGFEEHYFRLADFGRREKGSCYMEWELPSYLIREIRTGQYRPEEDGVAVNLWQEVFLRDSLRDPPRLARPRHWYRFAAGRN